MAAATNVDASADHAAIPIHLDPKLAPRRRDATSRYKLLTDQQQGTYILREMPSGLRRAPDIDWARVLRFERACASLLRRTAVALPRSGTG
jgi:hypothetical protein